MNKKILFYALAGLFAFLLAWQFVIKGVINKFESLDRDIAAAERTLEEIRLLEKDYIEGMEWSSGLDGVLAGRHRDYTPLSFLERLSEASGVKYELVYREPRPVRGKDDFMEASVRVELSGIDAGRLIEYIYGIENSGEFLRLRNLVIRPHEGLLRASFEVATIVPG